MRVRALGAVAGLVGLSTALMGIAPAGAGPSGSDKKFCKAVTAVSVLFGRIEEEPTPKQEAKIGRLVERIQKNAPEEVADAAETATTGVTEGSLEDPVVLDAINTVDEWVADNCGYEVIPVTALDYEFQGLPDSIDAGTVMLEFTNEGAELHEVFVARIKGDESIDELIELPEEEAESKIQPIGAGFAAQGETTYVYLKLKKPGNYGAVCFIPVGSTSFEAAETADGPPHAMEGMIAEFTVEK